MTTGTHSRRAEHCARIRTALLNLHRTLVELERREYEKTHGHQSAGDFLQVMAFDDSMKWLEPLSRLIVMLDEALDQAGELELTPTVVVARTRELLKLDRASTDAFATRYLYHFDNSADLAVDHTALLQLIGSVA
ncbi:hypothetical protein [Burkholderia lata]|uniref:Uncharacterized protein n=1 Tax=Burkholderia lata (strain ATCC 17760 / DSM 23089 / LMG 22485 / NCIMB 9086 / R18194 / 383) TaxID=482957 RepID=A0A6P2TJF9_BURL3|nr:hypothetical protein [Burkholderia lata]VWC62179.1 hypothetical protein BLA18109_01746 [Burkholderia lata]